MAKTTRKRRKWLVPAAVLLVLLLLAGAVFLFQAKTIEFSGSEYYTDEELYDLLFEDFLDRNTLIRKIKEKFVDPVEIPFIDRYEIHFDGINGMEVVLYEKEITGYITYMGSNMYFDRDGYVVASTEEVFEGIPRIDGFTFDQIVLNAPLDLGNEKAFMEIMSLTQFVKSADLDVETIWFDENLNTTLYIGDILVYLGDNSFMQDKISELQGIIPSLAGRKGVLYMDSFDPSDPSRSFLFKDE